MRERRIFSAMPRAGGGAPIAVWVTPGDVMNESTRKVHVQALARNKKPEVRAMQRAA